MICGGKLLAAYLIPFTANITNMCMYVCLYFCRIQKLFTACVYGKQVKTSRKYLAESQLTKKKR